jgi:hypothetical protein
MQLSIREQVASKGDTAAAQSQGACSSVLRSIQPHRETLLYLGVREHAVLVRDHYTSA